MCTDKSLRTLKNQKSGAETDNAYQSKFAWFKRANIFLQYVLSSRTSTSNLVNRFFIT